MNQLKFVEIEEEDLTFVKEMYDYYTLNTTVVYSIDPVPMEDIRSFVPVKDPLYRSFMLLTPEGEKCGFCYFNKFKPRAAFSVSVEITIYLKPGFEGRGYGTEALMRLEDYVREGGFTNIVALISGDNMVSRHLFEKCGYTCSGNLKNVARKFDQYLDLMFYQKEV